jgi:hypothetical protein
MLEKSRRSFLKLLGALPITPAATKVLVNESTIKIPIEDVKTIKANTELCTMFSLCTSLDAKSYKEFKTRGFVSLGDKVTYNKQEDRIYPVDGPYQEVLGRVVSINYNTDIDKGLEIIAVVKLEDQ